MSGVIRAYRQDDGPSVIELSNRSFAQYAGWTPRTLEYWRWSVLERPGVNERNVLVLESDGRIAGCAVLHESGHVLEFLVDPDGSPRRRRARAKQLIDKLEELARACQVDMLVFSAPLSDRTLDKTLRDASYVVERNDYFSLGILNPQALLQQLLTARRALMPPMSLRKFVIELKPGQYPFLLMSRLKIQLDPVSVEDISTEGDTPGDCVIRTNLCALTEIIFCRMPLDALIETSQLEILPTSASADARALLNALAVDAHWHVPATDGF
jgi:hypothetical protein